MDDFGSIFLLLMFLSFLGVALKFLFIGWIVKKVVNKTKFFDHQNPYQVRKDDLSALAQELKKLEQIIHKDADFHNVDNQFQSIYKLLAQQEHNAKTGVAKVGSNTQVQVLDIMGKIMAASNQLNQANRISDRRYESAMGNIYSTAASCGINPSSIGRGY